MPPDTFPNYNSGVGGRVGTTLYTGLSSEEGSLLMGQFASLYLHN